MSTEEPKFETYMRAMFIKHGSDYDAIQDRLNQLFPESRKDRERMSIYGHFYYYICAPWKDDTREELQIVGMTSLIEAMMADTEFQTPFEYFKSEFAGQNSILDFAGFEKGYLERYGTGKRVREYFKNYISEKDAANILGSILVVDKQTSKKSPLEDLEQLAKLLYQMRSDFVHNAHMRNFAPKDCFAALVVIGKKIYDIRVNIPAVLDIFEKSFVAFWSAKI